MALDTNIALGVRPVEQPNMLAQMGQMMQLRQAQQGYESENALRDFYAQGGDLSTAEGKRQLMSKVGLKGMDIIGKQSEIRARDVGTLGQEYKIARVGLTNVNDETGYYNWVQSSFNNPAIAAHLTQMGITPEKALANARATVAKDGLSTAIAKSSMGIDEFIKQDRQLQNDIKRSQISAAPGHRQASIAEQEFARKQQEMNLVRGILTGGATPPTAPPAASNAPMGGGGGRLGSGTFNIPMGGAPTGAATKPNVLATQVAPLVTTPPPVNALLNPPVGQTGVAPAANRVDQIKQQLTQLAVVGGPVATQAMEGLVKEYNVLNPAGKIEIDSTGTLRTIDERSGTSRVVTGADGKPVMGKVAPVTKDVLDPTDPAQKRMITVDANTYVAGTGLGADGNAPPPRGVLGVAGSPIPPNYMRDPTNPQGFIPVPGSAADPNAVVPANYRKTADGKGLEAIPGGPADPKVIAAQNTVKLSAKDAAAREASYPRATTALKSFDAKTDKFDRDIAELLANEKGLNEITGFFAGRTDLAAMSKEARRALALFNTITAKGGFSELQDMRNASPTGGALGNVSNQEGKQLIDSFAALSRTQNANDVRKSLETARSDLQNLKQRMREAYDLTYEYRNSGGGAPALPPGFKAD